MKGDGRSGRSGTRRGFVPKATTPLADRRQARRGRLTGLEVLVFAAAGVTAIIGYTTVDLQDEGASVTDSGGSAWYIGANLAF